MTNIVKLVSLLVSQKGDSYVFGVEVKKSNSDPTAFDCSELIEWGCAQVGVKPEMPDGSWWQYQHCLNHNAVLSVEKALIVPGSLLFIFSSDPNKKERPKRAHVAMSLGNGMTIEARGKAFGVGIFATDKRGWTHAGLIPGLAY
jgi:cell wall-associated NlpC family hydrolase